MFNIIFSLKLTQTSHPCFTAQISQSNNDNVLRVGRGLQLLQLNDSTLKLINDVNHIRL